MKRSRSSAPAQPVEAKKPAALESITKQMKAAGRAVIAAEVEANFALLCKLFDQHVHVPGDKCAQITKDLFRSCLDEFALSIDAGLAKVPGTAERKALAAAARVRCDEIGARATAAADAHDDARAANQDLVLSQLAEIKTLTKQCKTAAKEDLPATIEQITKLTRSAMARHLAEASYEEHLRMAAAALV